MARLDAHLSMLLATKALAEKKSSLKEMEVCADDALYVVLEFTGDIANLISAPFKLGSTIGQIAYGQTTVSGLAVLAQHPQVKLIEKQRRKRVQLDGSVPDIKANQVWARSGDNFTGYTGRGVVIGIVDSGIDFRHHVFRKPDGSSRVIKIWDQTLQAQTGETIPGPITNAAIAGAADPTPLGYGVEYTKKQINFTLGVSDPAGPFVPADRVQVRHEDEFGHGTHVAGIAAGDGSQSGHCHLAYRYIGVAPEDGVIGRRSC